ncbi:ABC transporter ATP-binding protein [Evansella sp. AB-rgal1]|uniref:ABC transporter ATP-binding protein n=1 Tax=Evansella sp. AB-rgal1 TaxID=3242696 RepID=UPI00359CC7A8
MSKNILEVSDLKTYFYLDDNKVVKSVDGVTFAVPEGKTLGIVGESGSGKSVTALSILKLIDKPGQIAGGSILFDDTEELTSLSESAMQKIRGNNISMIFQEPMTSLNPVHTIGRQIQESLDIHQNLNKKQTKEKVIELLQLVGIPSPEKRITQYPYELSGGMRQRVMIAMALACNPKLLIADEPTTALDVTIQAQILELIKMLQAEIGMSVVLITHDLGVVAETCDYVAVMYSGKIVEYSDVYTLFENPRHPYTVGLLNSLPRHDIDVEELTPIKGMVPSPEDMPEGCRFAPRCPFATDQCHNELPDLQDIGENEQIRCWIYTDKWDGDPEVKVSESKRAFKSY